VRPAELAARVLRELAAGAAVSEDGDAVSVDLPREAIPGAVRALDAAGVEVFGVERPASTLEEVFLEVTGGETV
jgi:hypothetical protein